VYETYQNHGITDLFEEYSVTLYRRLPLELVLAIFASVLVDLCRRQALVQVQAAEVCDQLLDR
jgi:hypothetical protein